MSEERISLRINGEYKPKIISGFINFGDVVSEII